MTLVVTRDADRALRVRDAAGARGRRRRTRRCTSTCIRGPTRSSSARDTRRISGPRAAARRGGRRLVPDLADRLLPDQRRCRRACWSSSSRRAVPERGPGARPLRRRRALRAAAGAGGARRRGRRGERAPRWPTARPAARSTAFPPARCRWVAATVEAGARPGRRLRHGRARPAAGGLLPGRARRGCSPSGGRRWLVYVSCNPETLARDLGDAAAPRLRRRVAPAGGHVPAHAARGNRGRPAPARPIPPDEELQEALQARGADFL